MPSPPDSSRPPKATLQHLLPKQALTRIAGQLAKWPGGRLTTQFIAWFVRRYGVNMAEAAQPDIRTYPTFNDFFARKLRAGARPLADAAIISPADGVISQLGKITSGQIIQAKNHDYSVTNLLGGCAEYPQSFEQGLFATIYLSPRDYHRVHMPCTGKLVSMTHIPGKLFSVNPATTASIPGLFARNERVICLFDSPDYGRFALVLVGATIVGSIGTVWHGRVNTRRDGQVHHTVYGDKAPVLEQGAEMGRFELGSTVIMLFESGKLLFNKACQPDTQIQLGQMVADSIKCSAMPGSV